MYSFGCSFITGTELSDHIPSTNNRPDRASCLTWPALLAKKFNLDYSCFARGGSGNISILDRLLQQAAIDPGGVFVINWTFIDRFDYSNPQGRHFNSGRGDWSTLRPNNDDDLSRCYYRDLHSEYRDKLTSLMTIHTAITVLSTNRVKFFMTYEDPLLLCDRWHAPPGIRGLQKFVRPYLHDIGGKTFLQWSREQGHEISANNHPLEPAHAGAAEIYSPLIEAILHTD